MQTYNGQYKFASFISQTRTKDASGIRSIQQRVCRVGDGNGYYNLNRPNVFFVLQESETGSCNPSVCIYKSKRTKCSAFLNKVVSVQMDSEVPPMESIQGVPGQSSDLQNNTIITRDKVETVSAPVKSLSLNSYFSSEQIGEFPMVTQRWMPLTTFSCSVNDGAGTTIEMLTLPEAMFQQSTGAPNLLPLENYVYGRYDMELRFVVNANKFQAGRVIASVKFDSYQADSVNTNLNSLLCRPHVLLDLTSNNEGLLCVPFRYHRGFIRNLTNDQSSRGVRPSKFATVDVQVLSRLRTGEGGSNTVDIRTFYRFVKADFAGMSYRVTVQMDRLIEGFLNLLPIRSIKAVVSGVETTMDQLGSTKNQDKPTDMRVTQVVPRPRLYFPCGKGLSDAIPMRLNPHVLTSGDVIQSFPDDPTTVIDIARIWGLRNSFQWAATATPGSELFSMIIDPTVRTYTSSFIGSPTPLEFVASMYMFWSGTIDLRFDFISNMFIQGAVLISAEFLRPAASGNNVQAYSTYTKTFHLGEQKSCDFRIPYIYDTVWRRNTSAVYRPDVQNINTGTRPPTDADRTAAIAVAPELRTTVRVTVINTLRPVSTAPQVIDVLIFMRAGPSWIPHSLIQTSMSNNDAIGVSNISDDINNFPENYGRTSATTLAVVRSPSNIYGETHRVDRVVVQMDSGEKEDEDTTDNFSPGNVNLGVQTIDSQVNIKDILRRPVLVQYRAAVAPLGANVGYFIPCMPPSIEFRTLLPTSVDAPGIFPTTLFGTPQSNLLSLYRFWRGSQRYTLVFTGTDVIYVTYVPHTGVRIWGNHSLGTSNGLNGPILGTGMATEIVIPTINPTLCIEVPYDTENNWTLMFTEDRNRNFTWRDKGDTNAGHLVIQTTQNISCTIFWHAGDDFQLGNFYGVPGVAQTNHLFRWNDSFPVSTTTAGVREVEEADTSTTSTTQASTPTTSRARRVPRFQMEACLDVASQVAGYVSNPFGAGIALLSGYRANKLMNHADQSLSQIDETRDQVSSAIQKLTDKVDLLSHHFGVGADTLYQLIVDHFNHVSATFSIAHDFVLYGVDIIVDLLVAWVMGSWNMVGILIFKSIAKFIGLRSVSAVCDLGVRFADYIRDLFSPAVKTQGLVEREPVIWGILLGFMGLVFNCDVGSFKYLTSLPSELFKQVKSTRGISYLLNMLRFVQATFGTVKSLILETLGFVSVEAKALQILERDSELMSSFVADSHRVMSEANSSMIHHPSFRTMFWKTVIQAYQIQKLICQVPNNVASPTLSKICSDVIRLGSTKFADLSASPVRYEPFVLCLEGKSKIGKSYLSERIAAELLERINFTIPASGLCYYRVPGTKFWSGYRDQPVIVYDDWMNITDPESLKDAVNELYQLKSTSLFTPEMAHLEEKKMRANPFIVILLTNGAFPRSTIDKVALHPDAFFRRRDEVFRASLKEEYEGKDLRDMTPEENVHVSHLEFARYADVVNGDDLSSTRVGYDVFMTWLSDTFHRYHAQETRNVQTRMEKVKNLWNGFNTAQINLKDPFSVFYEVLPTIQQPPNMPDWLPGDVLEAEIKKIIDMVETDQLLPLPIDIPPKPDNVFVQAPYILQTLWDIIKMPVDWIYRKIFEPVELVRCTVCLLNKEKYMVCRESREINIEHSHYVCESCAAVTNFLGVPRCRQCKSSEMIYVVTSRQIYLFSWLTKMISSVRNYSMGYLNSLLSKVSGAWLYGMNHIFFLMKLANVLYLNYQLPYWFPTQCVLGKLYDWSRVDYDLVVVDDPAPKVEVQVGNPFGQLDRQWTPMENIDPIPWVNPIYSRDLILKDLPREVPVMPCSHKCLQSFTSAIKFVDGKWWSPVDGSTEGIYMPLTLCVDQRCITDDQYCDFLKGFFDIHKSHFRELFIKYANSTINLEYVEKHVPHYFIPDWVKCNVQTIMSKPWYTYLSDFWITHKNLLGWLAGIVSVVGVVIGVYKTFQPQSEIQGWDPNYNDESRLLRTHLKNAKNTTLQPYFQNTGPTCADAVCDYLCRNFITIELWVEGKRVQYMNGLGYYNHKVLIPRHYSRVMRKLAATATFLVFPSLMPEEKQEYTYSPKDFIESPSTDLAEWTLPVSFMMFKDIRKFLCKLEDVSGVLPSDASLIIPPLRSNRIVSEVLVSLKGFKETQTVHDSLDEPFLVQDVFEYNFSKAGVCGSILLNKRSTRPILGMHFAGVGDERQGEGYAVCLAAECLEALWEKQQIVAQFQNEELLEIGDKTSILPPECNIRYEGTIATPIFLNQKTKIRCSAIQRDLVRLGVEVYTAPTILAKLDPRYVLPLPPLTYGVAKHGKLTRDFPSHELHYIRDVLIQKYLTLAPSIVNPQRLTVSQAVCGLPAVEYYEPLALNKSAGYPWCLAPDGSKAGWCEIIERDANAMITKVKLKDKLEEKLESDLRSRREGIACNIKFIDTLKDERKLKTKILKPGATRVFCNCPFEYVVACRQNFLHFSAAFMKNRLEYNHAVGINANGTEWTRLVNRLNVFPNIVCLDYSNFGPGFNAVVGAVADDVIVAWTLANVAGVNEMELQCLMSEVQNSQHIKADLVYRQKCGSPSGAPLTTVKNSLVNQALILMAWSQLHPRDVTYADRFERFYRDTRLFVYGDDLIMSVSNDVIDWFNGVSISNFFRDYGIVASDVEKTESVRHSMKITEAQFLKRSFVRHPIRNSFWLGPLDWRSVSDIGMWVWESPNKKESTYINMQASLKLAHAHGKEKFDEWKRKLNKAAGHQGIQPVMYQWDDLDDLYFKDLLSLDDLC